MIGTGSRPGRINAEKKNERDSHVLPALSLTLLNVISMETEATSHLSHMMTFEHQIYRTYHSSCGP
jgi:hypothetical protein